MASVRPSRLSQPQGLSDMLLYRLNRLRAIGGGMVLRYCEGRFGVTRREWVILAMLAGPGSVSSSELAVRVSLDKSATSKAVRTLQGKGLIERALRQGDRRYTLLTLTPAGEDLYARILPLVKGINQRLMASLSEAEMAMLDDFLSRMQRSADEMLQDASGLPLADRRHGGMARRGVP